LGEFEGKNFCQPAHRAEGATGVGADPLSCSVKRRKAKHFSIRFRRKFCALLIEKNFWGRQLKKCRENFSVLLAEAKRMRAETLGGFCARQGADCRLKKVRAFSKIGHQNRT